MSEPEHWLVPAEVTPHEPGFGKFTPKAPRLGLDTSVVLDAIDRGNEASQALLEAGRAGELELSVSVTLDEELKREHAKDSLWEYVCSLPRTARPSAVIGEARIGEMAIGDDGAFRTLRSNRQGDRAQAHSIRDEEHVSSAFGWGAIAFVTRDERILRSESLKKRGWRTVTPEDVLAQLALDSSKGAEARDG